MIGPDRILVLTDLFLGAVWADEEFSEDERLAVRTLLAELLDVSPDALPEAVVARMNGFEPLSFQLQNAAAEFADDPPMAKRRLLALVARMVDADGVVEVQEEQYLRELARHLGLETDIASLSLAYSIEELRETFAQLRSPPPPMVDPDTRSSRPPPPPMVVETPIVPSDALPPRGDPDPRGSGR